MDRDDPTISDVLETGAPAKTVALQGGGAHGAFAGERLLGIVSIRDLYQSVVDQMEADIILLAEGLLQG